MGAPAPTVVNGAVTLDSLVVEAAGEITLNPGLSLDLGQAGAAVSLDNAGAITTLNNSDLGVARSVVNSGTIVIDAGGNQTDLELRDDATFSGGGIVRLSGSTAGVNDLAGTRLLTLEDQRVVGEGNLGRNTINIVNEAGSFISANEAGGTLLVDPLGTLINRGQLNAANTGTLQLLGGVYNNGGGTILASLDSDVRLANNVSISGGELTALANGAFIAEASSNVTLSNLTISAPYTALNNSDTGVAATITNTGTLTIQSAGNQTDLEVQAGGATLTGGGEVVLSGATAGINDVAGTQTLTIGDQTIRGQGDIGRNTIDVANTGDGVVRADVAGTTLVLDALTSFVNQGLLQATDGATLELRDAGAGDFDNLGGVIEADAGSEVRLTTDARIVRGTLRSVGDGEVRVGGSQNATLDNVIFSGSLLAENNADLRIDNTLFNSGTITIASTGNQTDLEVGTGGAILDDGGEIVLQGPNAGIDDESGTQLLTIFDQTIRGVGNVGRNTIDVNNSFEGAIVADQAGGVLFLDALNGFTNAGLLQATNGGILELRDAGTTDFNNAGGVIEATDGSEVRLIDNARIVGGTLRSEDSGFVRVGGSQNGFLEDLTFQGELRADNNSDTGVAGTITNEGVIRIRSTGNQTDLEVQDGGATLTGGGTVVLSGPTAGVNDAAGTQTLVLADQTIRGAGQLGRNTIEIVAQDGSAILADGILRIDTVTSGFTTDGTVGAFAGGTLEAVGDLDVASTGALVGDGTVTAATTVDGLVDPGAEDGSVGTLSLISTLELKGNAESAFLISDTGNDLLDVADTVALDGVLSVALSPSALPDASDTFTLLESAGLSGAFVNVANGGELLTDDGTGSFTVNYGAGSAFAANQVVLSDFEVIPEPGTAALAAAGLLLLSRRRRVA